MPTHAWNALDVARYLGGTLRFVEENHVEQIGEIARIVVDGTRATVVTAWNARRQYGGAWTYYSGAMSFVLDVQSPHIGDDGVVCTAIPLVGKARLVPRNHADCVQVTAKSFSLQRLP